ncbi:MAG: hypothetical protein ACRC6E_10415 [Fusobacteriaceae bacterium]
MRKKSLIDCGKKISLTFPGTDVSVSFSRRGKTIKVTYITDRGVIPTKLIFCLYKAWCTGVSYNKFMEKKLEGLIKGA